MCNEENTSFVISRNDLQQDTYLAQCLTCGGRDAMELDCQKCLTDVYNLRLGFYYSCNAYVMLGANSIHCRSAKYQKIAIICSNSRYGTVYTCSDMT